jgi:lipopolysaccharide heptosyltransferase I
MRAILIVRLGAMGDIIHAVPVAAALRDRFGDARIDWVVDERHHEVLELVPVVDRRIVLRTKSASPWRRLTELRGTLTRESYDIAIDVQGLLKSAVVARLSGARRILGFTAPHLRERAARFLYTETHEPGATAHVIEKNLTLAAALGADGSRIQFPLAVPASRALDVIRDRRLAAGETSFAVLNPGAAWPNKRWSPERFGAVAQWLRRERGLGSVVTWGPGDEAMAGALVEASDGAAELAPSTSIADLLAIVRGAALVVSGDTGPVHLAAAVGTPIVGIYGPTDADRNGPWSRDDVAVSRFTACGCHHKRRCLIARWCLADISVDEVIAAIARRLEPTVE